jgi:hypothetical protein
MFDFRSTSEHPTIQRRREQDAKTQAIQAVEKSEFRRTFISNWQAKGVQKIEQIQVQNIARDLEEQALKKLEQRRQSLSELLTMEEDQYRRELMSSQESTVDRLKNTLALARQQRAQKEDKRKEFAQEQYMRMWRANCDDLRTIDSETYLKFTKEEQLRQAAERRSLNDEQRAEQARWKAVYEAELQAKIARDQADIARRDQLAQETRQAAHAQIDERARQREAEAERKRLEREDWRARLEAEQAEAERARQERVLRKAEQARAVSEWNEESLRLKKEAKARQHHADNVEMQQQLAEYEAELQRKRADRLGMQREMAAYRDYLIARKAEERRIEAELERVTSEYQQLSNAKQDAEWKRNQDRRAKLMSEVHAMRQQQIALKRAEQERARTREQQDRVAMDIQVLLQQQAEEQEEEERFKRELESKLDLEMQIRHKAQEKEVEKARVRQEDEATQLAEAQYHAFVRLEQGRARLNQTGVLKRH